MSDHPKLNANQIRAAVLPDLLISLVGPVLVYRLSSPYMPATWALLLAGVLPIARIGMNLVRHHRLNLIGSFALLAIALKILIALVFNDVRLVLVSDSLITAVYGILMLASLLTPTPLIQRFIESILGSTPAPQSQQLSEYKPGAGTRSLLHTITAVWGVGLLLECVARVILVYTLSTDQFLVISPIVRYGFLGLLVLWAILHARIRRRRQPQPQESFVEQEAQKIPHHSA